MYLKENTGPIDYDAFMKMDKVYHINALLYMSFTGRFLKTKYTSSGPKTIIIPRKLFAYNRFNLNCLFY